MRGEPTAVRPVGSSAADYRAEDCSGGSALDVESRQSAIAIAPRNQRFQPVQNDATFEIHYSIGDLARQWRLGRETVRLLVKDEPGVLKIKLGRRRASTRYSIPESVARRVHTKLLYPAA